MGSSPAKRGSETASGPMFSASLANRSAKSRNGAPMYFGRQKSRRRLTKVCPCFQDLGHTVIRPVTYYKTASFMIWKATRQAPWVRLCFIISCGLFENVWAGRCNKKKHITPRICLFIASHVPRRYCMTNKTTSNNLIPAQSPKYKGTHARFDNRSGTPSSQMSPHEKHALFQKRKMSPELVVFCSDLCHRPSCAVWLSPAQPLKRTMCEPQFLACTIFECRGEKRYTQ